MVFSAGLWCAFVHCCIIDPRTKGRLILFLVSKSQVGGFMWICCQIKTSKANSSKVNMIRKDVPNYSKTNKQTNQNHCLQVFVLNEQKHQTHL